MSHFYDTQNGLHDFKQNKNKTVLFCDRKNVDIGCAGINASVYK